VSIFPQLFKLWPKVVKGVKGKSLKGQMDLKIIGPTALK